MKKLRNDIRSALYNSDWNLDSVLYECQRQNISPEKVTRAIVRCTHLVKDFEPDRIGGALVIIFDLAHSRKIHTTQ